MWRMLLVMLAVLLGGAPPVVGAPSSGASYHVDCNEGDDAADGLSPATAWKSLQRVSERRFSPGDSIRFKRGTVCAGMLWPKGSGREGAPISVTAFGAGPLPKIRSGPENKAAFQLFNQEYWRVENIEFEGGEPFGVFISGDRGVLREIHLKNIVVHDVTGKLGKSKESGLIVVSPGTPEQRFDGVLIDGATVYRTTQWAGILVGGGDFGYPPESTRSTNVVVRNSMVHDVQGDGIILFRVNQGLIEKSVAWYTGMELSETIGTPNAIWTWMCRDCTVQYSEAFLTDSPGIDGGAFDIDYGNADNTVQYNYGHDTQGYCIAVFAASWTTTNSVVRGNVCVNNGLSPRLARRQGSIFLSTWDDGKLDGLLMVDNTVWWAPPIDAPALKNNADFVGAPGVFMNNRVRSTTPHWISSPSSLEVKNNTIEQVSRGEMHSKPRGRRHSTSGQGPAWTPPSSLAAYAGKWLLVSFIDAGDESRSLAVMLQSAWQQFHSQGLQVVLQGAVAADLAYDWHLQGIPLETSATGVPAVLPVTMLISPEQRVVRRWEGFVPPGELGLALRDHLAEPDYARSATGH